MYRRLFLILVVSLLCTGGSLAAEENFILMDGVTGEVVAQQGSYVHERVTPCSTFKIALSLMGYDEGILQDEETPVWDFQEGYDDYLVSWRAPQTPRSWITHSCIWYSRLIALHLGLEKIQDYLAVFDYGNQDMSGGLTSAWLSSSLKISPAEQASFIQRMVREELHGSHEEPLSSKATQMTKTLLFIAEIEEWKLFGKTGLGTIDHLTSQSSWQIGWFVGWIEKNEKFFPFAYQIRGPKIDPAQRRARVIELLTENLTVTSLQFKER